MVKILNLHYKRVGFKGWLNLILTKNKLNVGYIREVTHIHNALRF